MTLPVIWFVLIAVLFVGYLYLEGFDYGVEICLDSRHVLHACGLDLSP